MQIDPEKTPRRALIGLLGISETHFHRLQAAGVFKPVARGQYDLAQCLKAWIQYHLDGQTGSDMATEKRLLVIAQRKQIELRTRTEERELVPLAEAARAFNEAMVIVAGQLDGLPGRAAGELAGMTDPAMVRAWLFDETRRIRDAAAARLEDLADTTAGRDPAPATTA